MTIRDAVELEPSVQSAPPAAPARRSPLGRLVILAALAGLAVWSGLRIRAAMHTQAAVAVEREQAARKAGEGPAPANVRTVEGEVRDWMPAVPIEGTLAPAHEADLGFKVPGRLASIRVRMGEYVRQGQTLATLEQTEVAAQVKAAEAQVKAAEAQLALTDDSERRTSALVSTGAQPLVAGVQVQKQRELASAQADAARAQLALAQASLANHALVAPFSGHVTRVPGGTGMIVSPGVPLFHLQDLSTLKLVGTASEADAPLVRVGAPARVEVDGREVKGRVVAVLASVDPVTRRLPVEAQIPNDVNHPILAGSFVRASIEGQQAIRVRALPSTALKPGAQGEVMVVEKGHMITRKIGYAPSPDGHEILVRSGLQAGDHIVDGPSPEARDGDPVAP
jgi:RND family efflux transporter MFP subunit